jgi:hypothetical protein
LAIENNRNDIVDFLLQVIRIDPSFDQNSALRRAAAFQNVEMVKLLIADPRVDPSDYDNDALKIAYRNYNYDIIRILFSYGLLYSNNQWTQQVVDERLISGKLKTLRAHFRPMVVSLSCWSSPSQ